MKFIFSKKTKGKKDKAKLKSYWRLIYPKKYVDLLTATYLLTNFVKIAKTDLKEVDFSGKLCQGDDGFVYIDIDNKFVDGFFALLDASDAIEGEFDKPPYFGADGIGAHISCINQSELEENNIETIEEIGEEFSFELKEAWETKPEGWDEMEAVVFMTVDIPEIKKLRKSYGLPETYKDKGHDYHITFAVKEKK